MPKKNKTKTLGLIAVILFLILALMSMLLFFNERPSNEDVSSASDYHHIEYNGKKYDQSSEFLEAYYGGSNVKNLIDNIKKYKTYKRQHGRDELYLADILKSDK